MSTMHPLAPSMPDDELRERIQRLPRIPTASAGAVEICMFDARDDEQLLLEVGRLREESFRTVGGGSSKSYDLDEDDLGDEPYHQLLVVDTDAGVILAGCRIAFSSQRSRLATEDLFEFTAEFRSTYGRSLMDIGRMFIPPIHRTRHSAASSRTLDHLFRGLGHAAVHNKADHFFGRVVFERGYDPHLRDLTLAYLRHHYGDESHLLRAREPQPLRLTDGPLDVAFGDDAKADLRRILKAARQRGGSIPALVRSYASLTPSMRAFATVQDHDIGGLEETCLMVSRADFFPDRRARWLDTAAVESASSGASTPNLLGST